MAINPLECERLKNTEERPFLSCGLPLLVVVN
jgi:hypothetical protein